ncbi:MAG: carboxymuconolactone decarboxylase family protein [Pseudomonadales bacterium]|jgi:AhpD family alkylhydroperoxidase
MYIKSLVTTVFTLLISTSVIADGSKNSEMREAKSSNPLISLHPLANQAAASAYYKAVENNVFNGAIPLKYAQLSAISASVAAKCLYCIPAHTAMAKAAGATDEEIKTAVAIAADVGLNSAMLYGNQFDMDTFMEMFPQ